MLNTYRIVLSAEDEVKGESKRRALEIFKDALTLGIYGPTLADVELIEEGKEEEESPPQEKEE